MTACVSHVSDLPLNRCYFIRPLISVPPRLLKMLLWWLQLPSEQSNGPSVSKRPRSESLRKWARLREMGLCDIISEDRTTYLCMKWKIKHRSTYGLTRSTSSAALKSPALNIKTSRQEKSAWHHSMSVRTRVARLDGFPPDWAVLILTEIWVSLGSVWHFLVPCWIMFLPGHRHHLTLWDLY